MTNIPIVTLILALLVFSIPIQQSFGLISGISDYFDGQPNLYRIGIGVREFIEDSENTSSTLCIIPQFQIKDTNLILDPTLKLAETEGNFFMFLNKHGTDSYRYLKIVMPEGNGQPRYYGYIYDENGNQLHGYGFGLDSGSLVIGIETFDKDTFIDEDKRLTDSMEGKSKFDRSWVKALKQGDYTTNIVLYNYETPITEKKMCTLVIDWAFSIYENGEFSTQDNIETRTGILVDITTQFSPRQQQLDLKMESFSIQCKDGFQKLSQKYQFFHESRTACVTPETRDKLIERGWDLAIPNNSELVYFDKSQEMEVGEKFENFLEKKDYNNVPSSFVIGKYNFRDNDQVIYFCGEFKEITETTSRYFTGAINKFDKIEWGGTMELPLGCAISDDALIYEFEYVENEN